VDREKGPEDRRARLQRVQAAPLRSRPHTPGIAWSEDEQVIADIRAARAAGADHVIPFMHWGWEKSTQPDDRQRSLARRLIDEGASLVVGSHPHVTQGAEIYRGKPIVYSLGNFVFDGFDYENARRGWLLRRRSTAMASGTGQPWPPTSTVPARPTRSRAGDSLRQPGRPGNRPMPQPMRSSLDGPWALVSHWPAARTR
jgi:hypothetical protein